MMLSYLNIFRPLNVIFIVLAQWLCAYYLDFGSDKDSVMENGIYFLMLGTAAVAFYGYWLNDFLDKERDSINKPDKAIKDYSSYFVYVHLLLFVSLVLFCANYLPFQSRMVFLISLLVLTIYNLFLKNIAGLGNLLIAGLSFLSVFMVIYQFPDIDLLLLLHFAIISGLLTFSREIAKDAEDIEGDKATNANTLPILFGLKNTNTVLYMLVLFCISFILISLYYQQSYLNKPLLYVYYAYYFVFVIVPLYVISMKTRDGTKKELYAEMSLYFKYILFTGVLSILFF